MGGALPVPPHAQQPVPENEGFAVPLRRARLPDERQAGARAGVGQDSRDLR